MDPLYLSLLGGQYRSHPCTLHTHAQCILRQKRKRFSPSPIYIRQIRPDSAQSLTVSANLEWPFLFFLSLHALFVFFNSFLLFFLFKSTFLTRTKCIFILSSPVFLSLKKSKNKKLIKIKSYLFPKFCRIFLFIPGVKRLH